MIWSQLEKELMQEITVVMVVSLDKYMVCEPEKLVYFAAFNKSSCFLPVLKICIRISVNNARYYFGTSWLGFQV